MAVASFLASPSQPVRYSTRIAATQCLQVRKWTPPTNLSSSCGQASNVYAQLLQDNFCTEIIIKIGVSTLHCVSPCVYAWCKGEMLAWIISEADQTVTFNHHKGVIYTTVNFRYIQVSRDKKSTWIFKYKLKTSETSLILNFVHVSYKKLIQNFSYTQFFTCLRQEIEYIWWTCYSSFAA